MICVKEILSKMKIILILVIFFLYSCSSVKESAGVNRKSIDEFVVIENPPLVIPPDFNLLSPDQLEAKKIDDIENELAKEILFGLDENEIPLQKKINTMNQILLKAGALDVSDSIRDEIDEDFSRELNTGDIFQVTFENEIEILDAVKESERIRNKKFEGESISSGEVPIKTKKIKKKKKKRFFFF